LILSYKMMTKKRQGFALIELMVVVAILSVAAAILVPRFLKQEMKRKQEECHLNLLSLFKLEQSFFQKNGTYSQDLTELHWKPEGKTWHTYRFVPAPPPKNGFLFECLGNIDSDPTLDRATIDETGRITQVTDDQHQ